MSRWLAAFAAAFALYLRSLPPSVASYRDAGEMASSAWTLGVSHPTSYPLYVLLARLACAVPVGNPAYRVGLLSAAAGAGAVAVAGWLAAAEWGAAAGIVGALLLALDPTFWSVAVVQEMYALWILAAALLAALALGLRRRYEERRWLVFAFCFGLALGNRLDLLLAAPGLLWLALAEREEPRAAAWAGVALLVFPASMLVLDSNAPIAVLIAATALWRAPAGRRGAWAARSLAAAAAGLSVYLFLPVRSAGGPWLDWNHPATLGSFADSILRTRYGGTLDLLSKSYAKGELFGANMDLYGRHLWSAFGPAGLAAVLLGFRTAARRDPRRWLGQLAAYAWCGPIFLLIANMPPNPHAAAIVEPHYLLSDLFLVLWAAEGAGRLAEGRRLAGPALAAAVLATAAWRGVWTSSSRREHFFADDFARAALAAPRPGGVLVVKKDVPLYTLWYYQLAHGRRPDVRVVAQGLAGSGWYQAGWRRRDPSLHLGSLRDADGWRALARSAGDLVAAPDAELPPELAAGAASRGLATALAAAPAESDALWAVASRRGLYDYEAQPDFFASDVVDEFAQALLRAHRLLSAWAMHWVFPEPAALLGFDAYQRSDFAAARAYYAWAAELSDRLVAMAGEYRSLPSVRDGVRRQAADNRVQLGVALERLGEREAAAASYRAALERYPSAKAHFNLAALDWNRDWDGAERELEQAVALDPGDQQARRYLAQLRARRRSGAR